MCMYMRIRTLPITRDRESVIIAPHAQCTHPIITTRITCVHTHTHTHTHTLLLLCAGYGTEEAAARIGLSRRDLPNFVLSIESEELGITAGLQVRSWY